MDRHTTDLAFLAVLCAAVALGACADSDSPTYAPTGSVQALTAGPPRVIVTGQPGTSLASLHAEVRHLGGQSVRDLGIIDAVAAVMPDQAAVTRLANRPGILRVEADQVMWVSGPPHCSPWPQCKNDGGDGEDPPPPPPQETPWGITRVGADTVWGTTTGAGIRVAIVDTGIDGGHDDLNVAGGANFSNSKGGKINAWGDDHGHGTHVAGTVAALDNDRDVVGMAPNAELYAVKVLGKNGMGWTSDIIAGVDWSVANGAHVINMSLGGGGYSQAFADACAAAEASGVYIAAAAGNSGDGNPSTDDVEYPGGYPSTVGVAAVDDTDTVAYFSSDGPAVDHAAPGVNVLSTLRGGGTGTASGTSMASPHDAGAAALLLGASPTATNACVRAALDATTEDLGTPGHDVFYGHGLIDIPAALAALSTYCP